jgi:hypothetical protein
MKRIIPTFTIALLTMLIGKIHGQSVLEYSFVSQYEDEYTPLANPTILISGTFDDYLGPVISIPDILFGGQQMSTLRVTSNGWIGFGNPNSSTGYSPISSANPNIDEIIAPFGQDLQNVDAASYIGYETVGETTTIEWSRVRRFGTTEELNIQLVLNGEENTIQFKYLFTTIGNDSSPEVGMKVFNNPLSNQYANRLVVTGQTWLSSTTGVALNSSCRLQSTDPWTTPVSFTFDWSSVPSGCMDPTACNYDPLAEASNNSCEYCSCNICGCMDTEACNYDSEANYDDGSCYTEFNVFAPENTDICPGTLTGASYFVPMIAEANIQWTTNSGSTIFDPSSLTFYAEIMETAEFTLTVTDNNGCSGSDSFIVTVVDCVYGCMDIEACNYDPLANNNDNSCDYSCFGCTDTEALNYSAVATIDNGSCYYEGEGNTCANPIVLSCGLGVYQNMTVGVANDNATSDAMACGGSSVGGQRWYAYTAAFSSEITVSTINAGTNFDTYLKVYTGTCGDLVCVGQNDDIAGTGFQSQVVFNAVAGETYRVRVGGFVMQQGSFVLTFECGGGCLDEAACNYEPGAPFDDGSCTYGDDCYGCTDPNASNFSPIAVYNQGCQYQPSILVYHDMNGNGIHNNTEPGLANWPVYIPGMSATIYTNASGYIDVNLPSSSFQLELINNTENWISSTPDEVMIDVPEAMSASFGLIPSTGETFFVAGPYDGFWDIIHCNNGYETGVLINNTGSTPLTGTLTMTCDEQFTPEADEYGTVAPDQVAPGFAQWNISNYTAGSNQLFSMHIDGPGVDNLGTMYPFQFNLILVDGNGNEIYNNSWTTTPFVACAYDPNDITATPVGLYEPHYIMPGERLQYRIRFQNTGNYYAEDITIMDQLDPAAFDLTSFTPMYASADMVACLHDDGLVDFIFNDIYLPDSTTDEEGSHGFVVYMVEARADLAPNTVLYNQAAIFFEQNPAIITNQVFHTIFDCDSFTGITGDTEVCAGETITLTAEQPYVETYSWNVDGENYTGSLIELNGLASGTHSISLTTSNPLCDRDHMTELTISNLPILDAGDDVTICAGNAFILNATSDAEIIWSNGLANGSEYSPVATEVLTATAINEAGCEFSDEMTIQVSNLPSDILILNGNMLNAPSGASWQWYYNGVLLEGETTQNLTTNGGGIYYVVTTNEDGCSTTSQEVMVVGINDLSLQQVLVYPNPMTENTRIVLPIGLNKLTITDALGKVVLSKDNCSGTMTLNKSEFASGIYHLQVEQNNNSYTTRLIVN